MADYDLIETVRQALGRTAPLSQAPVPPTIDETIVRLVHSELGLPELFAKVATANKIGVELLAPEALIERLIALLRTKQVRTIALTSCKLFDQLDLLATLRREGFDARGAAEVTLDEMYDIDCGITDAYAAVAEIGGIVLRGSGNHARSASLVPPMHIAILEPKIFVPDLFDLFSTLPRDENDRFVIVTGPSKTADIEMNLVVGVHGPGQVHALILN